MHCLFVLHSHDMGPHSGGSTTALGHQCQVILREALTIQWHRVATRWHWLAAALSDLVSVQGSVLKSINAQISVRGADQLQSIGDCLAAHNQVTPTSSVKGLSNKVISATVVIEKRWDTWDANGMMTTSRASITQISIMTWWVTIQALCPGLRPASRCSDAWRWGFQSTDSPRKWVWLQAGCGEQGWTPFRLWDPHKYPTSSRCSTSKGQPAPLPLGILQKAWLWSLAQASWRQRWEEVGNSVLDYKL